MFFVYSETFLVNKCDSRVVSAMNASKKEEGVSGIYGDYNGVLSSLAVYMAILGETPWQPVRISVKEAREIYDTYPEFMYLCAAITQSGPTVNKLLEMDLSTKGATGPFTGWKLTIPKEMVEQLIHICQKKSFDVPSVVMMTNWDRLFANTKGGVLIVTPLYLSEDETGFYVNNAMSDERQRHDQN